MDEEEEKKCEDGGIGNARSGEEVELGRDEDVGIWNGRGAEGIELVRDGDGGLWMEVKRVRDGDVRVESVCLEEEIDFGFGSGVRGGGGDDMWGIVGVEGWGMEAWEGWVEWVPF